MYSHLWYKAVDNKLDRKDVELIDYLVKDRGLSEEEMQKIANNLNISVEEVSRRVAGLKQKKIILHTNRAVVNPIKLWNNYLYVLIKAAIKPPVVGMDVDYPTGWSDMMKRIIEFQEHHKTDIIRVAHGLHGIGGYDLLLICSFNDMNLFLEMMEVLTKEGWITKGESFRPNEYKDLYIYDPIGSPSPEEYDKAVTKILEDFENK